jgi:hypothetical protein
MFDEIYFEVVLNSGGEHLVPEHPKDTIQRHWQHHFTTF